MAKFKTAPEKALFIYSFWKKSMFLTVFVYTTATIDKEGSALYKLLISAHISICK